MYELETIASYVINHMNDVKPFQLHKLLFYSQGFHYKYYNRPLINEDFFAFNNGPVIKTHISTIEYLIDNPKQNVQLNADISQLLDTIINEFGQLHIVDLSDRVKLENPWKICRSFYKNDDTCTVRISKSFIQYHFKNYII